MKSFKEFESPGAMNVTDALKMLERYSGEIDIACSISKSSKAIDDLIDFKLPNVPKMIKPKSNAMLFKKQVIDPFQYEKISESREPEPLIIMPELTPNKSAENFEKDKRTKPYVKSVRKPLSQKSSDKDIVKQINSDSIFALQELNVDIIIEDCSEFVEPSDINTYESQRSKFMNFCIKKDWVEVEKLLRTYNKESPIPQFKDSKSGITPLMLACRENRLVIVDRLLEVGAEVNEKSTVYKYDRVFYKDADKNPNGWTALHFAAKFASENIVRLLLSKNADANIAENRNKCLPIHLVCSRADYSANILILLLNVTNNGRRRIDKNGTIPLIYAIESESFMSVKELLKVETDFQMNAKRKYSGDAAIHIACRKKNIEVVRILCEADSPIDIRNALGQTALHICAEGNDEVILQYLYTNKANANVLDNMDRSALHLAAEKGNTKIVEFLIEKFKCNLLTRDKNGNTLMHISSCFGFPETTMVFLKKGVPLHMPNKTGSVCLHAAAQSGHVDVVKALLEKGSDANAKTKDLYTALHIAVKYGHPKVVETLIGYGSLVNAKGGWLSESPLHIAASSKNGEKCTEMLLKSGANINDITENGETALHITARSGNLQMLKSLLSEGGNPIHFCYNGNSPLHIAVRYCHFPVVQELIHFVNRTKSKEDVTLLINLPNNEGETALHLAAEIDKRRIHSNFEDIDIIKLLLEYDGDLKTQTKLTEETPLHYCAQAGNSDILLEMVKFLDSKIQYAVNKQAKNGWSPLLYASEKGHHHIVNILLKNNARVDVFDEHGMTALHLAAEKGHMNVVDVLLTHKAFVNAKSKEGLTALHLAAQNGFKELVEKLINQYNAATDALTLSRKTPLHLAAQYGKKSICQSLLYDNNCPADPNALDSKRQTPLHLAAKNDHSEVVRLFIKFNPELLVKHTSDGMTCGHIAAANGCLSVIKEFMRYNKSIFHGLKNKSTGSTPLHLAVEGGHYKVVKALLDSGAKVEEENNDGMTSLHLAAKYGHIHLLNCLKMKMGFNVVSVISGLTPLHIASHYGQIEIVREILIDIPPNIKSECPKTGDKKRKILIESGLTPLHLAAQSGHENLVRLLLNCDGVEVISCTKKNGLIPLHFAAQNGHTNVASLLLSKSVTQISRKDFRGRTALHFAASHGHLETAGLFINQGADVNAKDYMCFTPLHYASKSGYLRVCKLLVESGASCEIETYKCKIPLHFAAHFNHTKVVSFLLQNKHPTYKLMEDNEFLFDLMICSKLSNFRSLEELVLRSSAPAEVAAKLGYGYQVLAENEKERSRDLLMIAQHCQEMCTSLVSLAAIENGADKLLKAIDNSQKSFLDILIETEQKEVIAHPSIQRYLSDIWMGNLSWPVWKLFILSLFLFIFPISWLCAMLPFGKKWFKCPVLKFIIYFISHLYLTILFFYVGILDSYPCYRTTSMPYWYEWLLLINLSGLLVSLLIDPLDVNSIAVLKYIILFLGFAAIFVHLSSTFLIAPSLQELIYIRNQFLAFGTFMCLTVNLDFLSMHYLFGPWTIIIKQLVDDLFRFLVILFIFLLSFSCILNVTFKPILPVQDPTTIPSVWSNLLILYFAMFGQGNPTDLPLTAVTPSYAIYLSRATFGISVMITNIVLVNLLIAMMADTYDELHSESDILWKFGRAKVIRNMKKTTPLPSPFIFLSQFILYASKLYYIIQNKPIPASSEENLIDYDSGLRRKSQISPNIIEVSKMSNRKPDKIKDVVNWTVIVRRYLMIRSSKGSSDALNIEDFPEN